MSVGWDPTGEGRNKNNWVRRVSYCVVIVYCKVLSIKCDVSVCVLSTRDRVKVRVAFVIEIRVMIRIFCQYDKGTVREASLLL